MKQESVLLSVLFICSSKCISIVSNQVGGIRMCQEACLTYGQCSSLCFSLKHFGCTWNIFSRTTDTVSTNRNRICITSRVSEDKVSSCDKAEEITFVNICANKCPSGSRLLHTRFKGHQCVRNQESCPSPPVIQNAEILTTSKTAVVRYSCNYDYAMIGKEHIFCAYGKWIDYPGKCYRVLYRRSNLNISTRASNNREHISASLPYPWTITIESFIAITLIHKQTNNWTIHFSCDKDTYFGFITTGTKVCCHQSTRPEKTSRCTKLKLTNLKTTHFNVSIQSGSYRVHLLTAKDHRQCTMGMEASCVQSVVISGDVVIRKIRFTPSRNW